MSVKLLSRDTHTVLDALVEERKNSRFTNKDIWSDPIWSRQLKKTPDRPMILAVIIDPDTGCAIWQGSTNGKSHAVAHGRPVYRWYYEYFFGPMPINHECHHLCGDGLCVNPQHIIPVTRSEHMRIEAALRAERGIFSNRRKQGDKLNEQSVRELLELVWNGASREEVAQRFDVSISMVSRIVRGERWGHIVEEMKQRRVLSAA